MSTSTESATVAESLRRRCRGAILSRCRRLSMDRPQDSDLDDMTSDALLSVLRCVKSGRYTAETLSSLIWSTCRSTLADWIDQRSHSLALGESQYEIVSESMRCPDCAGTGDHTERYELEEGEWSLVEYGHCERCQGSGEIVEPVPQHLLNLAFGTGGSVGADLRLTAHVLSKGMTQQASADLLNVSRSTLIRRINKLKDRLDLFNPKHTENPQNTEEAVKVGR